MAKRERWEEVSQKQLVKEARNGSTLMQGAEKGREVWCQGEEKDVPMLHCYQMFINWIDFNYMFFVLHLTKTSAVNVFPLLLTLAESKHLFLFSSCSEKMHVFLHNLW